jgi:hypothetical protein
MKKLVARSSCPAFTIFENRLTQLQQHRRKVYWRHHSFTNCNLSLPECYSVATPAKQPRFNRVLLGNERRESLSQFQNKSPTFSEGVIRTCNEVHRIALYTGSSRAITTG